MSPENPNRALRVGLIGCGNIGSRAHAPAYARLAEAKLVATADLERKRAEDVAAPHGATAYADYRELIADPRVDAVDVCLPTSEHAETAVAALEAGKHVLCEKPMAATLEGADSMIAASIQADRLLMIGHIRRFDHRYVSIRKQIEDGRIGKPVLVRRTERQHLPFPPQTWQWDLNQGGGVVLDIGVHTTDLFAWLLAQQPISVYARGKAVRSVAREVESLDHVLILCRFEHGALGLAEISWAYPDGYGGGLYSNLEVVGTNGKLEYSDKDANPMLGYKAKGGAELPRYFRFMSTTEFAFEEQIRHFALCVREGIEPRTTMHDARLALELALAAQRSVLSGEPVDLPLDGTS